MTQKIEGGNFTPLYGPVEGSENQSAVVKGELTNYSTIESYYNEEQYSERQLPPHILSQTTFLTDLQKERDGFFLIRKDNRSQIIDSTGKEIYSTKEPILNFAVILGTLFIATKSSINRKYLEDRIINVIEEFDDAQSEIEKAELSYTRVVYETKDNKLYSLNPHLYNTTKELSFPEELQRGNEWTLIGKGIEKEICICPKEGMKSSFYLDDKDGHFAAINARELVNKHSKFFGPVSRPPSPVSKTSGLNSSNTEELFKSWVKLELLPSNLLKIKKNQSEYFFYKEGAGFEPLAYIPSSQNVGIKGNGYGDIIGAVKTAEFCKERERLVALKDSKILVIYNLKNKCINTIYLPNIFGDETAVGAVQFSLKIDAAADKFYVGSKDKIAVFDLISGRHLYTLKDLKIVSSDTRPLSVIFMNDVYAFIRSSDGTVWKLEFKKQAGESNYKGMFIRAFKSVFYVLSLPLIGIYKGIRLFISWIRGR